MGTLLDLFFPQLCVICGKSDQLICPECRQFLVPHSLRCPICRCQSLNGLTHQNCHQSNGLDGLFSLWNYHQLPVRRLIHSLKYEFNASLISALLPHLVTSLTYQVDTIVPLPLHYRRQNWRGFNQAQLISNQLGIQFHLPVDHLLSKTKATPPLATISSFHQRQNMIKHVFSLTTPHLPQKVLLVDDVFTTGSTLTEATSVLKGAGVKQVYGWVLAS